MRRENEKKYNSSCIKDLLIFLNVAFRKNIYKGNVFMIS